jgi:hypothetical protein
LRLKLPDCPKQLANCNADSSTEPDGRLDLGQVIPNDLILCGNTSSTFWKVTPMKNSSQALTPADQLFAQAYFSTLRPLITL